MGFISEWFQLGPIPTNAIVGYYDLSLVALSFVVAVMSSYVALNIIDQLRIEKTGSGKLYWLFGGAFTMGAGIWSMHFIGMLALVMPLPLDFHLGWTLGSLVVAISICGLALLILQKNNYSIINIGLGGVIIGLGVATMHYMGVQGIREFVSIHYLPGLFALSIVIAIIAAQIALWLALQHERNVSKKHAKRNILGALVLSVSICGMHYTGMAAAVYTSSTIYSNGIENIQAQYLAFFIGGVVALIISMTLMSFGYYRKLLESVENEKEFLNAMLDNLDDGIVACDAKGNITVFNKALQKNIVFDKEGKTIDDLFNEYSLNVVTENHRTVKQSYLNRALRGERIRGEVETIRFKNDWTQNLIIDGQQIINSNSEIQGAVLIVHDVTELKQTEKLKKEFVSIVSHELRTPLTSIRGSLGLLINGVMGEFTPKVNKLLEIANSNCERLLLLISDILDIEKIEAGKMVFELKRTDLMEMVNSSVEANQMYANQYGVSLQFIEPDVRIFVNVDTDRLMQVLANLISNACKFSPKGESVSIEMKKIQNKVRVLVSDKGPGVPLEFQSRIFQKFAQADSSDSRRKGGTGLGLSISRSIIEKFGGVLHFITKPNEGATFYFDLPIAHEEPKLLTQTSSEIKVNIKRLLVCDDDEDQSKYLKVLLESAGYTVDVSNSVMQAKKSLMNHTYDALLLDLILPDQDGIAFIRELQDDEKLCTLRIIVISVIADTGRSLLNGGVSSVIDWLSKPIDFNTLLASLSKPSHETNLKKTVIPLMNKEVRDQQQLK